MSRLVVIHQGALGDFLLTLSVLQPLRSYLESSEVVAIAGAASARLAARRSAIDQWYSPEQAHLHSLFRQQAPADEDLAELIRTADCVVSFLGDEHQSVSDRLRAISAPHLVCIDPRPTQETSQARKHITHQWWQTIRATGLLMGPPEPAEIRLPLDNLDHLSKPGSPVRIMIHPGSGGRAKCWPVERFEKLADTLKDVDLIWMLGPVEHDQKRFVMIEQRARLQDESLVHDADLEEAARQIAGVDLYVGNDAGATHLAAALGVPTVAVFGPTDPATWRPLGDHVTIVAPATMPHAITDVGIQEVAGAIRARLARARTESSQKRSLPPDTNQGCP